jgi:excisionase family DNA binding protein
MNPESNETWLTEIATQLNVVTAKLEDIVEAIGAAVGTRKAFTLEEAAAYMSLDSRTLRRKMRRDPTIPYARIGKGYRFLESDLANWIRSQYGREMYRPPQLESKALDGTTRRTERQEQILDEILALSTLKRAKEIVREGKGHPRLRRMAREKIASAKDKRAEGRRKRQGNLELYRQPQPKNR